MLKMISSPLHPLDVLASTFPQMEKTAEMFPVSLDGREANLADETLPLGVEMVLPAQLIEVTLLDYHHLLRLKLNWQQLCDPAGDPLVLLSLQVLLQPLRLREVNITHITAVTPPGSE